MREAALDIDHDDVRPPAPRPEPPAEAGGVARRVLGCDPLMSPAWRWRRAQLLAEGLAAPPGWLDDPVTRAAADFLRARAAGTPTGDGPLPEAVALYEADGPPRWYVEALVLSRMKPRSIARRVGVDAAVVELYESLFLDVRVRLRYVGWVIAHTVGWGGHVGFDAGDIGGLWRWVGYTRGLRALDLVRAVTAGVGRERFAEAELDEAELLVAMARVKVDREPDRVVQLHMRLRAEAAGLPAAAYHLPRRRPPTGDDVPRQVPLTPLPPGGEAVGEFAAASHNGRPGG